nr:formyltransferase family protein [Roseomonas sp. SXEYE001]
MALPRLATTLAGGTGSLSAQAREAGIPEAVVEDVNGPAFHAALRAAGPDLIVTFHFDQILSAATIALAPMGGINIHPSLLPRHRGPIPTFWAGAEAEPAYGVTIHRLVPRIDAGPILAQRAITLPPGITASAAARRLHQAAVPLAGEVLQALASGTAAETPAAEPLPYCPFPDRAALRQARRRGARLLNPADIGAALRMRV